VKRQLLTSAWVAKAQLAGVEFHLPRAGSLAVKRIPDDGNPQALFMVGVEPELVGAASHGDKFHPRAATLKSYFFPVRDTHLPMQLIVNLDWTVIDIEPERKLNGATFLLEHAI